MSLISENDLNKVNLDSINILDHPELIHAVDQNITKSLYKQDSKDPIYPKISKAFTSEMTKSLNKFEFKKPEEKLAALFRLLYFGPEDPKIWHNIGLVYLELKQPDQAKAIFMKAISCNKTYADPYLELANFYKNDIEIYKGLMQKYIQYRL